MIKLLRDVREQQINNRIRSGVDWQGWSTEDERKTALVFTTENGEHIDSCVMYRHCKKMMEAVGATDSRVHTLRHSYAVLSLQNGDDIKTIQSNLGHATSSFTLDVYGHCSDRMKQESADRMEAYYQQMKAEKVG